MIFGLIKVDVIGLIKTKASLSKNFHIQPSEIDVMPMWEFEMYIKCLNDLIEEENERQQAEMDKHKVGDYQKMANPRNLQRMSQTPKMPNISSGFKLPK